MTHHDRAATGAATAGAGGAATITATPAADAHHTDWAGFVAHHWNTAPVRLTGTTPPLGLAGCHDLLVRVAEPFRAGTRLRVPTVVSFDTTRGRLRAPGPLLPANDGDGTDHRAAGYLDRVSSALAGRGWLLAAANPLRADFRSWARVRDQLAVLWREHGWPVTPVSTEITAGSDYPRPGGDAPGPGPAVLLWVLSGSLRVRFPASAASAASAPRTELRGVAGDLLHWPAGPRPDELHGENCVTLRIAVRSDAAHADELVRELLHEAGGRLPEYGDGDGRPCLLHEEPPRPPGEPVTVLDATARVGEIVGELAHGAAVERALLRNWAARRSAAGLDPAPPPRTAVPLGVRDRVRLVCEVTRMPTGDRARSLWAANGHAFTVGGSVADRILTALPSERARTVTEVADAAGPGTAPGDVRALIGALHRVRAVDVTPASPSGDSGAPCDDAADASDGSDDEVTETRVEGGTPR
ncbi:hypothetical protein [Streptomyces otsuchiensis]|uniref:hypothetical protein n=1 Tax=Streptomyces otsuchiensis TaxID=2681388 RepID=UPI00103029F1|nr:hypothetical protein [Streptomyces otsuchiensis]